jgi:ferredoxin
VRKQRRINVNRIACDGRGLCAELLPELITLDDWGFPIVRKGAVPDPLVGIAEDTVDLCPKLALRLVSIEGSDR